MQSMQAIIEVFHIFPCYLQNPVHILTLAAHISAATNFSLKIINLYSVHFKHSKMFSKDIILY